ncbi:hypothetical protein PENARI_c058G04878 [Penicillium arizonense]|uniref:Major facilitator superfamily (MFS) profile domain-containing protein n=1 Tax=Penicillium arizonense TaxID=1835702 RepID=A0A1F5L1T5_PENAI|nr:hypothetical protein PENARI_c058G04878 [Penicillium arizonense]OGE47165.1 hypothetical protein PENARI_c058G04878 [Penicillium arizonense]
MSVAGGLLTLPAFNKQFPRMDTINTEGDLKAENSMIQGTVIALYTVGGIFGALSCAHLGDRLGRKKVIFWANFVCMIGCILMATSFDFAQFIVARIFLGAGIGGYTATVPIWQSEISPTHKRGSNVVTDGVSVGVGVTIGLWVDLGFYFVKDNSASWRFPLAFPAVLCILAMVSISMLPESPRWLILTGQIQEARKVIWALFELEPDSDEVTEIIHNVQTTLAVCGNSSWTAMFTNDERRLFHRAYLACTGQFFQQMCGVNLITYYAISVFQEYLGMDDVKSRILAAAMGLMQPTWSAGAMAICMGILAGTTSPQAQDSTAALVVAVIALFCFQFIFTVGYSGLTFLYAAELAPLQVRATVSAFSTATVWVFNFLLAEVTPIGFNTIHNKYYIVFAVINAIIVPSVYLFFPETKGRSLEEIDKIFAQSKNIFDPPRMERLMRETLRANDPVNRPGSDSCGENNEYVNEEVKA